MAKLWVSLSLRCFTTLLLCENNFDCPVVPRIKQYRSFISFALELSRIHNTQNRHFIAWYTKKEFWERIKLL